MKYTLNPFIKQLLSVAGVLLAFLIIVDFFNIAYPVSVQNTDRSGELAVIGEGSVDVVPDQGTVDVGISVANAATAEEVRAQIDQVNNTIIQQLQGIGIPKEDIKTANYSVYPNVDYEGGREISGYTGEAQVTITVRNPDTVGQVIDTATQAGANNIYGSSFTVSDPSKYREEARAAAIANAREQAQQIANDLGLSLGKVTNIVESGTGGDRYPVMRESAQFGGGGAPQFEPGSQKVTSTITLYFDKQTGPDWFPL